VQPQLPYGKALMRYAGGLLLRVREAHRHTASRPSHKAIVAARKELGSVALGQRSD